MFIHTRDIAQESRKHSRAKWAGDDNRVVYACFMDVHTISKIRISTSTSTSKWPNVLVIVLTQSYFTNVNQAFV